MEEEGAAVAPHAGKVFFDAAFKLEVVACAKSTTNRQAAAKFFVEEKSVGEWRKKKEGLLTLPDKKKGWMKSKPT